MIKLVFFAGSARRDSLNKKLAKAAANSAAKQNIETTFIDLADFDIPIFNADLEHDTGTPQDVDRLKALLASHDGMFISSPEYNGAYTGLLKNMVDWMSRNNGGQEIVPFKNAVVAISACSPGMRGGLGGLNSLRLLINHIGGNVIPKQAAIGGCSFDDQNNLKDENHQKMLDGVLTQLIGTARIFKN